MTGAEWIGRDRQRIANDECRRCGVRLDRDEMDGTPWCQECSWSQKFQPSAPRGA